VINDISNQKLQLEAQNNELKMEACRKDEIIDSAIKYVNEKETELERIKTNSDATIGQFRSALGTALWLIEREMFMRKLFQSILTKATLPPDIDTFLLKHIVFIVAMMNSDEGIHNQEIDGSITSDYFESKATILSSHYLQLPIPEEISFLTNVYNEINTLPSFIKKDVIDEDKK
jgi:hypothetical protein